MTEVNTKYRKSFRKISRGKPISIKKIWYVSNGEEWTPLSSKVNKELKEAVKAKKSRLEVDWFGYQVTVDFENRTFLCAGQKFQIKRKTQADDSQDVEVKLRGLTEGVKKAKERISESIKSNEGKASVALKGVITPR